MEINKRPILVKRREKLSHELLTAENVNSMTEFTLKQIEYRVSHLNRRKKEQILRIKNLLLVNQRITSEWHVSSRFRGVSEPSTITILRATYLLSRAKSKLKCAKCYLLILEV